MALTRTAAQLEASARSRADLVGSNFRASSTFFEYLSASCRDLVSLLSRIDDYWFEQTTVLTSAGSITSNSALASVWKVMALRVTLDGVRKRIPLASVDELDLEVSASQGWSASSWPRHRIRGERIYWAPIPLAVHTVTLDYLPVAIFKNAGGSAISALSTGTDTFDGIFGWEDWVVLHTAIKLKTDQEKDPTLLRLELAEREASLILAAQERAAEDPQRIRDTWCGGPDEAESDYAP